MKDAVLQLAGPAYTPQEQPDGYVRRLEAACQLLHEGLRQTQATGAQAAFPGPSSHKAAPAAAAPTPSATGIISAGKLCTLLLTDQDLLDVVLALHDVRAAQLCHLMPWSGSHALKLPPPSGALAKQLSQSQRSVPGSQLLAFVSALDSDNSLEEEVFAFKELITTCQEEGPSSDEELWKDVTNFGGMALLVLTEHSVDLRQTLLDAARATSCTDAGVAASRHFAAEVSSPLLVSDILSLLARFLPEFRAARVAVELVSRIGYANQRMAEIFLTNLSALYVTLHQATVKLTGLMPDWRYRPAVLRTGLRVAIAGALAHNTMASLFPYLEDNPAMVQRMPAIEAELSAMSSHVAHLWSLVLAQDGVNAPPARPLKLDGDLINRMTMDRVAVLPSPSSPQLVPLALHLVLGMENMLQMVMRHQEMVWKWPYWNDRNSVQSLVDGYRTLLALFGHVIEVLATPSVVGPAGLAAQPASWLPCGNSL
ncbi:hypothetical protein HaLaN_12455, partial [Haematococcus lacustris]